MTTALRGFSLNKIDLIIRTGELLGRDEVIGHFLVYCVSTPSLLLDKMDARDFAFNLHTAVVEWVDPRRYSMPTRSPDRFCADQTGARLKRRGIAVGSRELRPAQPARLSTLTVNRAIALSERGL